jgi:hypothetical protein
MSLPLTRLLRRHPLPRGERVGAAGSAACLSPAGRGRDEATAEDRERGRVIAGRVSPPLPTFGRALPAGERWVPRSRAGDNSPAQKKSTPAKPLIRHTFPPGPLRRPEKLILTARASRILSRTFRPHRGIVRWCGRWDGRAVPLCDGSPAGPQGRRRDSRPFGPSRRYSAGGSRCARSIARRAMRSRRAERSGCRSGDGQPSVSRNGFGRQRGR